MIPSVLFARSDSNYKQLSGVDVWDIERNAFMYIGPGPVVCHPPCRAWGRLKGFAKPRPGEKECALFSVDTVRRFGGVLEHPAHSTLWKFADLPAPGRGKDFYGGWTLPVLQFWWGHRALKSTWLYIVGCNPSRIPVIPFRLDLIPSDIEHMGKAERERTTPDFCAWLLDLAGRCA